LNPDAEGDGPRGSARGRSHTAHRATPGLRTQGIIRTCPSVAEKRKFPIGLDNSLIYQELLEELKIYALIYKCVCELLNRAEWEG
jgi:hypothetical protein